MLNDGVALIAKVIDRLSEKHSAVLVRVLRGNHDEHAHLVLTFALAERYRDSDRVTVEKEPRDLFMMQWGRCLISAHHGDKAKPDRLAMYLSDVCPFWSDTRHRHIFTGHIHHDSAKDLGPMRWESLRAFCPLTVTRRRWATAGGGLSSPSPSTSKTGSYRGRLTRLRAIRLLSPVTGG